MQPNSVPDWLFVETLLDQGPHRAMYPYPLLNNILSRDDCRPAVIEDSEPLEKEFGISCVEPLYRLLWRINTIEDVFTSHLSVSAPETRSPFDWATAFFGTSIVIMPRKQSHRHQLEQAMGMARMLARTIGADSRRASNTSGWHVRVFPAVVTLAYEEAPVTPGQNPILLGPRTERPGYGHELVISGSAGNRGRAAERWSRAIEYIVSALAPLAVSEPYRHFEVVNGERTWQSAEDPESAATTGVL